MGAVIGAHRPETDEFVYDVIDVVFFQKPIFSKKKYQDRASEIVFELLDRLKAREDEQIIICSSYIFDRTIRDLKRKYGRGRLTVTKIVGRTQHLVETAYIDEVRNLGYEPILERENKRAKNFFHMLRWLKKDRRRLRYAKTGWPRLGRYVVTKTRTNRQRPSRFYSASGQCKSHAQNASV